MAFSPEMQAKMQIWRQKAIAGTITQEELREAIQALREDRLAASTAGTAKASRKSTPKAPINSDDLLAELGDI